MKKVSLFLDRLGFHPYKLPTMLFTTLTLGSAIAWWCSRDGDWEPVTTTFGILAAAFALVIDPWIENRQTKREIVNAIKTEMQSNDATVELIRKDHQEALKVGGLVYGRLLFSALDRALTSGVFSDKGDHALQLAIQRARIHYETVNVHIGTVELRMLFRPEMGGRVELHTVLLKDGFGTFYPCQTALADAIAEY